MIARNYLENSAAISHEALVKAFNAYASLGYRPIPLVGFAAESYREAKTPAIRAWQNANPRIIDTHNLAGLGLVVGAKSRHIVLDSDCIEFTEAFYNAMPELAKTWIVETGSKNKHFHYRLEPSAKPPKTMRYRGHYDFLAAAGYVVAPPTQYEGYSWLTIEGKPEKPLMLGQAAISQLIEFLAVYRGNSGKIAAEPQKAPYLGELCAIFDSLIVTMPRNAALFNTALSAFSNGYSEQDIAAELLGHFVNCPPTRKTQNLAAETSEQRRHEGLATIASACSGKYRASKQAPKLENMPANELREYLLKNDDSAALRLIEALYRLGVSGGQVLSRQAIEELVAPILSPKQIRTALESKLFNGNFGRIVTQCNKRAVYDSRYLYTQSIRVLSSSKKLYFEDSDRAAAAELQKTMPHTLYVGVQNGQQFKTRPKTGKIGRPSELYIIPPLEGLMKVNRLKNKGSDIVPLEALKSDKAYRTALLSAFIERNPNRWSWRFLAGLLGVSRDSIKRYAKEANIVIVPQVERQPINRYNAMDILPEHASEFGRYGYWLEDSKGNKHAPSLAHAMRLLPYGALSLCKQLPNYFASAAAAIPPHILDNQPKQAKRGNSHE